MSTSSGRPIPVGKLVSVTRKATARPPAPEETPLERALPVRDYDIPWLLVSVIGGTCGWVIALVALASAGMQTTPKPAAIAAAPVAQAPDVQPEAAVPVQEEIELPPPAFEEPRPVVAAALQRKQRDDEPLAIPLSLPPIDELPPAPAPQPVAGAPGIPAMPGKKAECRRDRFGTEIQFVEQPTEAFRLAKQQGKMVFMIHLSGNFEDKEFTWNNAEAFRVNALSNPRVAEFINDHFIATYMKVGTFQIINGEKVGGNVASYFCLPDSTVVHAVPGKTDAKTLLSEAHFALETRKSAMTLSTDLVSGRTDDALYAAHVQKAHAERFLAEARPQWRGRGVNAERMQHLMPTTLPRNLSQQAQAEWLLARNPLERLHVLYPVVWTNILNEQLSTLPVARQ